MAPHGGMGPRVLSCRRSQTVDSGHMLGRRIKLAPYLSGALWRLRQENGTFILFNSLPIAKREASEETWTVIAHEFGAVWKCSMEQSAFRMGHYGTGVLWCVRERRAGTFIAFNNVRIAQRETWSALQTGWKVTPIGIAEVHVQLNGSDGVIVAYRGVTYK